VIDGRQRQDWSIGCLVEAGLALNPVVIAASRRTLGTLERVIEVQIEGRLIKPRDGGHNRYSIRRRIQSGNIGYRGGGRLFGRFVGRGRLDTGLVGHLHLLHRQTVERHFREHFLVVDAERAGGQTVEVLLFGFHQ